MSFKIPKTKILKNFALIGAAGFVAERHIRAIKETNNNLLVAHDKFDVMGRIDSYFPNSEFFLESSNFENFVTSNPIDFVSICSPNFMHKKHIELALNSGSDAICEKPLVLYPNDLKELEGLMQATGKKINTILQLRLHPTIIELKQKIEQGPKDKIYDIDLTYITSRGKWYYKSWKTVEEKSGGVATNIGIHFFDMLIWIFGDVQKSELNHYSDQKAAGVLQLKNANVRWFLSLDYDDLSTEVKEKGIRTFRSLKIENKELEFSNGFANLHTKSYEHILGGNGFTINDVAKSIVLTDNIRNTSPIGKTGDYHPALNKL